ncbi:MAG TPA: response regulator [Xanthobacteraceae bacterium]|nr:response regulator [Xanthobacteraceae bacterium]
MLEPAQSPEASEDGLAAASATQRGTPRLLVIDDDNLHRMIICRVAAKAGYAPAGAATYDEAAKLAQEAAFDCITLDLSLGAHAGVEMLRHLWVIGCKAPIIVISGCDGATCSETLKIAKSLNLNIWQSMPKPVDLAVLRLWFEQLKSDREAAAVAAA